MDISVANMDIDKSHDVHIWMDILVDFSTGPSLTLRFACFSHCVLPFTAELIDSEAVMLIEQTSSSML